MTSESSKDSRGATSGGALVLVATPIGNLGDMS
ncbi:MAG: rRNA (cytidine-2'-O-)-methyltransferase, partial [Actinobacteria bacterium]|nr:rRNA (cytidine-2'-O-)-methyltransferase [Actinomycetota bacterium]